MASHSERNIPGTPCLDFFDSCMQTTYFEERVRLQSFSYWRIKQCGQLCLLTVWTCVNSKHCRLITSSCFFFVFFLSHRCLEQMMYTCLRVLAALETKDLRNEPTMPNSNYISRKTMCVRAWCGQGTRKTPEMLSARKTTWWTNVPPVLRCKSGGLRPPELEAELWRKSLSLNCCSAVNCCPAKFYNMRDVGIPV
jgi:hypothetical protein